MQKSEAIQNHKIKPEEAGYYHVMFTKILTVGKRTIDEFHVVLYSEREFRVFKQHTDKNGLNATGFDEYEVVHNPHDAEAKRKEREQKAEEKHQKKLDEEEAQEKMKALLEKEEENVKDEIKAYLTEKGIKFHPKIGLAKLKALKEEN